MSARSQRMRGGRLALAAVALTLVASAGDAQPLERDGVTDAEWAPVLEPGVLSGGDAFIPVRAPEAMAGTSLRPSDLLVEIAGEPMRAFTLAATGPAPEGVPLELVIVVQPSALGTSPSPVWAAALSGVLESVPGGQRRRLVLAGGDRFDASANEGDRPDADRLHDAIVDAAPAPLWDEVLVELDRLASGEGAPRRVMLIVSSGHEPISSRHPAVTCIDAAARARVAIYALAAAASRDGRARLAELVRESGGALRDGGALGGGGGFIELVHAIGEVRTIRIPSLEATTPIPVRVGMGATPVYASGSIRARRAIGVSRPRTLGVVALVVAIGAALAVVAVVADRVRPRGHVLVVSGAAPRRVPVTRKGLTIGAAAGNGLVVADPQVSRHHAVIRATGEGCVLVDLRSSNGTTVNDRRVTSRRLSGEERIVLGGVVELRFEAGMGFAGRRRRGTLAGAPDDTRA